MLSHLRKNVLSQCAGKIRHRNRIGATVQIRILGDPNVSAYKCPHCNGWHVGQASGATLKRQFLMNV
jgi:hypothetical protein